MENTINIEELKQILKENLNIEVEQHRLNDQYLKVSIYFGDTLICEDIT